MAIQAVLRLPPHWDLAAMPGAMEQQLELLGRLVAQNEKSDTIAVDLSAVERFDSCGLAALLELHRHAQHHHHKLHWLALSENLQELARIYGVSNCFAESIVNA